MLVVSLKILRGGEHLVFLAVLEFCLIDTQNENFSIKKDTRHDNI